MKETRFLITYGLHNFVRHEQSGDRSVFTIRRTERRKMIGHAASLISGRYGDTVDVRLM